MTVYTWKPIRISALVALCFTVASCSLLPAAGPSVRDIRASSVENGGDIHIVDVTPAVASAAARGQAMGFSAEFASAGMISVDRINAGDKLSITVWENVDNGLFSAAGLKVTVLPEIQVDQLGNIFVPYAGTIRATGRTPDDLRVKLTELLENQTPDPQIEVRRTAGEGATVSIIGEVGAQGVYPIVASTRKLTGMLAQAGGITLDGRIVKITVRRGQQVGQIWLQDLYDNAANDIPLRAGDKVILERDERYFVVLGTTSQRRVSFETHNPTAIEALASVGGLRSFQSDPRGIFIFREEPAWIANRVLGRDDITQPQKLAYIIDLTGPSGMFTAQDFEILNNDTIYVTEAPLVAWNKIIGSLIGALSSVTSLESSVSNAAGVFE